MKDILNKLSQLEETAPKAEKQAITESVQPAKAKTSDKPASLKELFRQLDETVAPGQKPLPVLDPTNKKAGMGFVTSSNPAVQNMLKNLDPKDVQIVQAPGQQPQSTAPTSTAPTSSPAPAGSTGQAPAGQTQMKEKWAGDTKLNPAKKGMFAGKTKAELEKQLAALHKSGPHKKGSPEYTKQQELNFAIRAKSGWKKPVEEAHTGDEAEAKFNKYNAQELDHMLDRAYGRAKPGDAHKQKRARQAKDAAYKIMWNKKHGDLDKDEPWPNDAWYDTSKELGEADIASTSGIDTKGAGLGAGRSMTTLEAQNRPAGDLPANIDPNAQFAPRKIPAIDELKPKATPKKSMMSKVMDKLTNKKAVKENMNKRIRAAHLEGKSHGLMGHAHCGRNYENMEEARAYHEGYKLGLDECHGMAPIVGLTDDKMPPATVHGMADQALDEGRNTYDAVVNAIRHRILHSHRDLIAKYGPVRIMAAIEACAEGKGNLEEIGTSDVSIWVNQVIDDLEHGYYDDNDTVPVNREMEESAHDTSHGSAFDRGSADSYYGRARDPHKYPNGTGTPPKVKLTDPAEIKAYHAGYDHNEEHGDKKDWGFDAADHEVDEGNAFTAGLAKTPKGGTFKLGGKTIKDTSSYDAKAFESWDRQLENLINEGVSISVSKGNQGAPDSVNINATDQEADKLLALVKHAGMGIFADEAEATMAHPHQMGGASEINTPGEIEVVGDHDKMLSLMKRLSGINGQQGDDDYADEEEACNECGMMECGCPSDGRQMMDEVESEDQMTYQMAEDNPPDNGSANSANDTAGNAAANASLASADQTDRPTMAESEECDECHCDPCKCDDEKVEESFSFANLYKKMAMLSEESTAEKDDKAERAGKKIAKDIEYDEGHKGKDDDKAERAGKKVKKDIEYDDKKDKKLDEWANDAGPGKSVSDTTFEQDIEFMTKVIAGGLNKPKSTGQTTVPVIAGQNERMHTLGTTDVNESISDWKKLAGL